MELEVIRKVKSDLSTIGDFKVNGKVLFKSLEDKDRGLDASKLDTITKKVYATTAIAKGRYKVIVDVSTRFKKRMPLVLDTPGFKGVRIHAGNSHADTEGCILIGMSAGKDFIYESRKAFDKLMLLLEKAIKDKEEIWLTVKDA